MATYVSYTPTSLIAKAMFNFDAFGGTNFIYSGDISVSVSDGFSSFDYLMNRVNSPTWCIDPNEIVWTTQQKANINGAFDLLSSFAGVKFLPLVDYDTYGLSTVATPANVGGANASDINIAFCFADSSLYGASGGNSDANFGYLGAKGDIFINYNGIAFLFEGLTFADNSKGRQTLLHEALHSLGLSHPFLPDGGSITVDFGATVYAGFGQLGFKTDTPQDMNKEYFTIMSYDDESFVPSLNAYTPMILDVIALQAAYGEGSGTTGAGDDLIKIGTLGYRTYFDKGGYDTVDLSLYSDGCYFNMGVPIQGASHLVGVAMSVMDANSTIISGMNPEALRWFYGEFERAKGSDAADVIVATDMGNVIDGLDGDDFLFGGSGADAIDGGRGNDEIRGGSGSDTLTGGSGDDFLSGGQGADIFLFGKSANGFDTIEDFSIGDRVAVSGVSLTGQVAVGNGTGIGSGVVQADVSSDWTVLYIGTDGVPGADLQVFLSGSYAASRFSLANGYVSYLEQSILPTISVVATAAAHVEGDVGSVNFTFDVDRVGDISAESSVNWSVGGAMVAGSDFVGGVLPSGTLNFSEGEASKSLTISVLGDTVFEADESFEVLLADPVGAMLGTSTAVATILNDDPEPGVSLLGTPGDDTMSGGPGDDTLNGLSGYDTAAYGKTISEYTVGRDFGGYSIHDVAGDEGTDTAIDIEQLRFADMTVNLVVQDKAAAAPAADVARLMELYVAFFNRVPDADGMSYWIDQKAGGQTINQIAESFYNAGVQYSELTGFSPSMTNADFVNVVYRNVLGRQDGADASGLAYWTGELASGRASHGSLVSTILDSAHTFKGDAIWGWVADLLDNKIAVAQTFAIDSGLNYNTPEDSIANGMAIAAAITPTDASAAIALIGVDPAQLDLVA